MKKVILKIGGMSCSACSVGLEKYLNKQEKIRSASVNLVLAQALIEYDDDLSVKEIEKFVHNAGFESLGVYDNKEENKESNAKKILIVFSFLSILVLYISMASMIGLPSIPFLDMMKYPKNYAIALFVLVLPFLVYGFDIFKSGVKNLIHKTPNMDTLVSLGVLASFSYSVFSLVMILLGRNVMTYVETLYFESCAIVIFFIKFGRFIDNNSKEKTKEAIAGLVQITPSSALLKIGDVEKEVTIDEVRKGDILICKPGMKIAVDGIIKKGETHLDESFITGESIPSKKGKGKRVVAGSINIDGYIEYEALKIGKDSTISEIVRLVVEATNTKPPIGHLADRVCGIFVPTIIVVAIVTLLGYLILGNSLGVSISAFCTVLVVACPCALGLATPLAIVISEGFCAKNGILVKNSRTLENAHKIDTVVFDKTGTLTYGDLKVSKIFNYSEYTDKELMQIVASIEKKSTHPIGRAFVNYADSFKLSLNDTKEFKNIPGVGIEAKVKDKKYCIGNIKFFSILNIKNEHVNDAKDLTDAGCSIVYVIEEDKTIGLIGVKDVVRNSAKSTIEELKRLGKEVIMLTGDNEKTAQIIASSIGIRNVIANVMPEEKTKEINRLIAKGCNVMMVGDGINDAPSLAKSNIGVSINSGTDIAMDSSDVILTHDDLEKIPMLIKISKRTITNIKENLFWAFFYNLCMIPIAIGLLKPFNISINPMMAGFAMTISSLTVVFNALRLRKWRIKK